MEHGPLTKALEAAERDAAESLKVLREKVENLEDKLRVLVWRVDALEDAS